MRPTLVEVPITDPDWGDRVLVNLSVTTFIRQQEGTDLVFSFASGSYYPFKFPTKEACSSFFDAVATRFEATRLSP